MVQYLLPLMRQPSPWRRAVVVIWCVFVPAFGSVIENDRRLRPVARPGSHSSRSAALPCCSMIGAQMEPITSDSIGQPWAATSSTTTW